MTSKFKLMGAVAAMVTALCAGGIAIAAPQDSAATPPPPPPHHPGKMPPHGPGGAPGMFGKLDHEGQITRDAWMKAAADRFAKLDLNKDGKLTRDEIPHRRFGGRGRGAHHGFRHGPRRGPHGDHRRGEDGGWHNGMHHAMPQDGRGDWGGQGPHGGPQGDHRRMGPPPQAPQPQPNGADTTTTPAAPPPSGA